MQSTSAPSHVTSRPVMRARAQVREELGIGVAAAPPGTEHRSSDQILTGQEDFQRARRASSSLLSVSFGYARAASGARRE